MRRTVRAFSGTNPHERLTRAVSTLPEPARAALGEVVRRTDLPLVAGTWRDGSAGCLVANVVTALGAVAPGDAATLDLRVLEVLPELSSRDLNRLIVAWDEAAGALRSSDDTELRELLRGALAATEPSPR